MDEKTANNRDKRGHVLTAGECSTSLANRNGLWVVMPWGGVGVAPECRLNDSSTLQSSWSEPMSIT